MFRSIKWVICKGVYNNYFLVTIVCKYLGFFYVGDRYDNGLIFYIFFVMFEYF